MTEPSATRRDALGPLGRAVVAAAADLAVVVDSAGVVVAVEGRRPEVAGAVATIAVGVPIAEAVRTLAVGDGDAWVVERLGAAVSDALAGTVDDATFPVAGLGGADQWVDITVRRLASGGALVLVDDATASHREVRRLARLAEDPVTGLAGRALLLDRLEQALRRPEAAPVGVVLVNLDRFRGLAVARGTPGRDAVLVALASRLVAALPPGGLLAQPRDDAFALVVDGAAAAAAAEHVRSLVAEPLDCEGWEPGLVVTASIGVAVGRPPDTADTLLRDAELAAVEAAADGGDRVVIAADDRRQAERGRHELEQALRTALAEGGLRVVYQPEISLETGLVVGAEALMRWDDPRGAGRSPADVVALAEEVGLIGALGAWVLRTACREAARWPLPPTGAAPYVAVNVSGRQLDEHLVATVADALTASGLPPARLCLEVTETVVLEHVGRARATLDALKALGVSIALDDFGTGYAGLGHLVTLPIDILKLDARFVAGMAEDAAYLAVVETVVALAQRLGLLVVAEGVEGSEQQEALAALGYDVVQGYGTGRPADSAALVREVWRRAARRAFDDDGFDQSW